jgi:hypothetical protein
MARVAVDVLQPHMSFWQHLGSFCYSGIEFTGRENSFGGKLLLIRQSLAGKAIENHSPV